MSTITLICDKYWTNGSRKKDLPEVPVLTATWKESGPEPWI